MECLGIKSSSALKNKEDAISDFVHEILDNPCLTAYICMYEYLEKTFFFFWHFIEALKRTITQLCSTVCNYCFMWMLIKLLSLHCTVFIQYNVLNGDILTTDYI